MHGVVGALQAASGYVNRTSTPLPTVSISGISATPIAAATLANDGVAALGRYVARQQAHTGVPPAQRAKLQILNSALPFRAQVFTPRSKTPPVV